MDYPIYVTLILIVIQTVYSTGVNTEYDLNQRPFFVSVNPEIHMNSRGHYVNKRQVYQDDYDDDNFDYNTYYTPNIRSDGGFDGFAALNDFLAELPTELRKQPPKDGVHYLGDVYKPDYYLPNRYGENKPISLEYQPNRPFFAGSPRPYPEPIIRPGNSDRFGTTQKPELVNTIPGRPPIAGHPKPYPEQVTRPSTVDRYGETTQNVPNLEYVPSRPPFAGKPKPYPEPIIRPESTTHRYGEPGFVNQYPTNLNDRYGETTTRKPVYYPNQPIDLSYKPMRPFYAPSRPYPEPIIRPETTTDHHGDRYGETTSGFVASRPGTGNNIGDRFKETTTTQRPYQTNEPIDLNYKPMKPFFAPSRPYPEPIIRPETTQNVDNRYGETTQRPFVSTPSGQTLSYYDDFLLNLQMLYDYVIELQKTTPKYDENTVRPETTIDINKFAEAIKPFLTTTTQRPAK